MGGVYDQSITSIRTETSGPNSVLVSWMLLNQTLSSNEKFSIYYTTGGSEVLARTTNFLMYNITGLVSNVEYPIRIEMFSQMQNSSLQTFHLLKDISPPITIPCSFLSVPTDSSITFSSLLPISPTPSPMLPSSTSTPTNPINETISTSTEVPISSTNFQFTHQLAFTVGVVLIILFFVLFIFIISITLCCCMKSMKRSQLRENQANQEKTLEYLHEHINQANSDFSTYATTETEDKFEGDSCVSNPMYSEVSSAHKENLVKTQVSCLDSKNMYYNLNNQ